MEREFKIDREIVQEIQRLEEMYQHYKKLYFRLWFFCCMNERAVAKYHKDEYGKKLKELKALQTSRL